MSILLERLIVVTLPVFLLETIMHPRRLDHASCLFEVFWVEDSSNITLLHSLEGERGNNGSTNTTSVFGSQDLYWVFLFEALLSRPVKNLSKCLCAARLEVWVLVEHGAISTHVAGL